MLVVLAISIQPPKLNSPFAVPHCGGSMRRIPSTLMLAWPSITAAIRRATTAAASTVCRFGAIHHAAPSGSSWNRNVPIVWFVLNTPKRSAPLIAPANTHDTFASGIASASHGSARYTSCCIAADTFVK